MNKKGQYEIGAYWAGFSLIFSFLLVVILLSLTGSVVANERLIEIEVSDTRLNLFPYLQTPVGFSNGEFTMQELLLSSYYNGDYDEFNKKTREILTPLYPKDKCTNWNMYVVKAPENEIINSIENIVGINIPDFKNLKFFNDYRQSKIVVPRIFEEGQLEIRVVELC